MNVEQQLYATPQQESSYKFPRTNAEAAQPPHIYGHNSNRVHSNNQYDSGNYLGSMVSFGGNTSASQRFQRQMMRSSPYNLEGGVPSNAARSGGLQQE